MAENGNARLLLAVIVSFIVGGVVGFIAGVASTKAGSEFLDELVEQETQADVEHPKNMVRPAFELQYPGNWRIDTDDEDYDQDQLFSIESPGAAFAMFVIGQMETDPEQGLKNQLEAFGRIYQNAPATRFERYGSYAGKGAVLKAKVLGVATTARLFSMYEDGWTVMITQQCPDEDLKYVEDGLSLIEESFRLRTEGTAASKDEVE